MKPSVALIGPGKVGSAIVRRLFAAGYPIVAVIGRQQQQAAAACAFIGCSTAAAGQELSSAGRAGVILLAVPDDQIKPLAEKLAAEGIMTAATTLVHFSGLHPAALLASGDSPAARLSLHPLLPFADREIAFSKLSGCPFAVEGDRRAMPLGEELVSAIGGLIFPLQPGAKALYHAAACLASNYFVTLVAAASELLQGCGINREQSIQLLTPLLQATLENIEQLGPGQALTGPIVRGDAQTLTCHQQELQRHDPELLPLYELLAARTLQLARESGRLRGKAAEAVAECLHARALSKPDRSEI